MNAKATLQRADGPDLVLEVVSDDSDTARPRRWIVTAQHHGPSDPLNDPELEASGRNLAIVRCEVVDDGAPVGQHPRGGIDPREQRLPDAVAHAVERELDRLWNAALEHQFTLLTAGFIKVPRLIHGQRGAPPTGGAEIARRVRRALRHPRASANEKLFFQARERGILQWPPHAREFTPEGAALLDAVDAAKEALVRARAAGDSRTLLPFPSEVIDTAYADLDGEWPQTE